VLDDVASRTAIAADAAAIALKHSAPHLLKIAGTDVKNISSNVLAESIAKGDVEIRTSSATIERSRPSSAIAC
jgi:hypothetical protein